MTITNFNITGWRNVEFKMDNYKFKCDFYLCDKEFNIRSIDLIEANKSVLGNTFIVNALLDMGERRGLYNLTCKEILERKIFRRLKNCQDLSKLKLDRFGIENLDKVEIVHTENPQKVYFNSGYIWRYENGVTKIKIEDSEIAIEENEIVSTSFYHRFNQSIEKHSKYLYDKNNKKIKNEFDKDRFSMIKNYINMYLSFEVMQELYKKQINNEKVA